MLFKKQFEFAVNFYFITYAIKMKLLNVLKDVTCLHTDVDDQKG